jgi:translation initiation factor IF-2
MPLLVGIGVGVGIAGAMYGLSQRAAAPQVDDPVPSAVAAGPVAAAPAPVGAAPSAAAVAPTAVPAAAPAPAPEATAAEAPGSAAKPAPSAPRAGAALRAAAATSASAASDAPDAPEPPVIAVQPAQAAPEDPSLEAVAEAADKPATTMDALLDEALSPKARRDELAARQQAALEATAIPPTPSRAEVTQAMTVLLPAIRGCAMGQSGLATAGIVVHSDGRVASVEIAGAPFAGSASGRCMEGVIRRARFPRFSQPSFRIKFPLAIQ